MDLVRSAKVGGVLLLEIVLFELGNSSLYAIRQAYDAACEVQSTAGPCASIGDQLYLLQGIMWLAIVLVPIAIAGFAGSLPKLLQDI